MAKRIDSFEPVGYCEDVVVPIRNRLLVIVVVNTGTVNAAGDGFSLSVVKKIYNHVKPEKEKKRTILLLTERRKKYIVNVSKEL